MEPRPHAAATRAPGSHGRPHPLRRAAFPNPTSDKGRPGEGLEFGVQGHVEGQRPGRERAQSSQRGGGPWPSPLGRLRWEGASGPIRAPTPTYPAARPTSSCVPRARGLRRCRARWSQTWRERCSLPQSSLRPARAAFPLAGGRAAFPLAGGPRCLPIGWRLPDHTPAGARPNTAAILVVAGGRETPGTYGRWSWAWS